MFDKVAVVGAGPWGATVATIAARSAPTVRWARRPELAAAVNERRENPGYLPGAALPSRNRAVGAELGSGRAIEAIVSEMQMVADVLEGAQTLAGVIPALMSRSAKAEFEGFEPRARPS